MKRGAAVDVPKLLERLGIQAKRRGKRLWAPCPFHEGDRTASWNIVDDAAGEKHGFHHCYGCEAGGGVVSLVQELLELEDAKAARQWIRDEGAEASRPPPERVVLDVARPRRGFCLPAGAIVASVGEWVTPARRYLLEDRGVPEEQAARWGLGYAVEGRLRGRVVFPVRDWRGRLVSYTARSYVGAAKKYLEPLDDEGADKGAVFGEEHWPAPGEERRVVVVLEGALDALAVERVTGGHVGAVYGSQLLPGHVARLSSFAEVVVASDPDPAGDKLAASLVEALARWSRVRRATLPDGYDAAALAKDDPAALARALGVPVHGDRGASTDRPGAGAGGDLRGDRGGAGERLAGGDVALHVAEAPVPDPRAARARAGGRRLPRTAVPRGPGGASGRGG